MIIWTLPNEKTMYIALLPLEKVGLIHILVFCNMYLGVQGLVHVRAC